MKFEEKVARDLIMATEKFSIKGRFAWVFLPMYMFRGNKVLKIF